MIITGYILFYFACGLVAHGCQIAYFQNEYPLTAAAYRNGDRCDGIILLVMGPLGLLIWSLAMGRRGFSHGWQLW
jgi:hypothetical protein